LGGFEQINPKNPLHPRSISETVTQTKNQTTASAPASPQSSIPNRQSLIASP
jgi:hypothetical protein